MSGVGMSSLQTDAARDGQEGHGHRQGEEEAWQGEYNYKRDMRNNYDSKVNEAFEILRQHTSTSTNHRLPKVIIPINLLQAFYSGLKLNRCTFCGSSMTS